VYLFNVLDAVAQLLGMERHAHWWLIGDWHSILA